VLRWYRLFLVTCLVGLFVDPLYFYLLHTDGLNSCVSMGMGIGVIVTTVRTLADLFYLAHMILKFRIAFVAPSPRVFGRGELVRDPDQIAIRYLKNDFIIDLAAMLPIPQVRRSCHGCMRGRHDLIFVSIFGDIQCVVHMNSVKSN
jgi:cyclic nucleotide gated channel, plant